MTVRCDLCGTKHQTQADALRCCSDEFDDDDLDDRVAVTAPDAHGSPTIVTDGGPRIQTSEEGRRKGRQSGKTDHDRHTCPKCGEEFGNLPNHLPACTGGESDD